MNDVVYSFSSRINLALPGNLEEAFVFATQHFITTAKHAIEDHGAFFVALSGGSTPKRIYQNLASPEYIKTLPWKNVHLFWSDERSVPSSHPDNNYKMAMDAGLNQLPIPKNQIHRMIAETNIEKHARDYEDLIRKELKGHPFDLIMLGMGDDGHTASLFPGTKALEEEKALVMANVVPQKNTTRMTFTYPLINQARTIVIYAFGSNKKDRIKEVFFDAKSSAPIRKVGTEKSPALWILDHDAAKEVSKIWHPNVKFDKRAS